uniref:ALMS motif domain-containing protein n=1 Tax=Elaeophora elaphi TaxID=1147741 RepID=A0A0R3RS64_9BILA
MLAEETDLVTNLLAVNRKLRQLYLAEQRKALMERKQRIAAEARLAALLSKEVIGRRERNSARNSCLDHDLSVVDKTRNVCPVDIQEKKIMENLLENGRNPNSIDSFHEDRIALSDMNNIKRFRKDIFTSESFSECTASSVRSMHGINTAERDGKTSLPCSFLSSERSNNALSNKASSAQCCFNLPQNSFEKPGPTKQSRFWLFIDKNGETKSSVPPPLNQIQQKRKEAFIRRSTERQILIREASVCRKELAAAKRKVAKQLLAGHAVNRNAVKVLSLMDREICAFPPRTMEHETIRRIYKTKEFQEKKKRRREEYDSHINRLLAYCYSQVILCVNFSFSNFFLDGITEF